MSSKGNLKTTCVFLKLYFNPSAAQYNRPGSYIMNSRSPSRATKILFVPDGREEEALELLRTMDSGKIFSSNDFEVKDVKEGLLDG